MRFACFFRYATGARNALALEQHIGHRFEREAVARGRLAEHGEVTGALRAEAEVPPDDELAYAKAAHQHFLDKATCRQGGKSLAEPGDMHALDADGGKELQLVAQPRQPRRRRVGGEELARMRLEGEDAGLQVGLVRRSDDPLDKRAVAPVHPVEITDGQRAPARVRLQRAVCNDHGLGLKD